MNSVIAKNETILSYIIAIALILLMVAASVILDDPEVILPEIAAMAIGIWVYREPGWIRQPSRIFVAPSITAAIGFAINQVDLPYLGKVSITLVLMMLFLRIIQSNFGPSLATGLLPLVTNAVEWSFMISVIIFSFLIMLGILAFKWNDGLEKKVKIPYQYMLVFLILIFVWIGLCWMAGYPQVAVIPPILVVVYESLHKPMFNGKMAFKLGLVLTISATVGTLLSFAIDSWVLVTLLDMILVLILLRILGMRVPAAYAFPLLPFVFPDEIVVMLPVSALVASIFLFGSVLLYKNWERKRSQLHAPRN